MSRSRTRREWGSAIAKVQAEGRCRNCGRSERELRLMGRTLDAAHTIGRTFDFKLANGVYFVHQHAVFPLCGPQVNTGTCHNLFDAHTLDMWSKLRDEERTWAVGRVGEGQARRKIAGRGR